MVTAQNLLTKLYCLPMQNLRLPVLPLTSEHGAQVVHAGESVGMVTAQNLLPKLQYLPMQNLRLFVVVDKDEAAGEEAEEEGEAAEAESEEEYGATWPDLIEEGDIDLEGSKQLANLLPATSVGRYAPSRQPSGAVAGSSTSYLAQNGRPDSRHDRRSICFTWHCSNASTREWKEGFKKAYQICLLECLDLECLHTNQVEEAKFLIEKGVSRGIALQCFAIVMTSRKEVVPRGSPFIDALRKDVVKAQQKVQTSIEEHRNEQCRDRRSVAPKTEYERQRVWNAFVVFFEEVLQRNARQVWIDLLDDQPVHEFFQAFFRHYVETAVVLRPCLGPEEYEEVRTLTSVTSVLGIWKSLLSSVDDEVFREKRRSDPARKHIWTALVSTKGVYARRPLKTVWIEIDLAEEYNLTRDQTFEKREMTSEDVLVLLRTVWTRGPDISCNAPDRLAFHTILVIEAIGGFRPGTVLGLRYDQVELGLVRDPIQSDKKRLVVTTTIHHNKQKTKTVKKDQSDTFKFSATLIPCPLLDYTGLIVSRALADDAFEIEFKSLEDILTRPEFGDVDYIPLNWKSSLGDKRIIPMKYTRYRELWDRTLLVACFRQHERPYSMRVGAGGRLDGALTPAVRSYVLSNTDTIFKNSYQPQMVRHDLQRIAWGEKLTGRNEELFSLLQRCSLRRDEHAPIYPTQAQLDDLEKRNGLQELRALYQELKTSSQSGWADPIVKRIAARIHWIRQILSQLLVQLRRAEYFAAADRLRAQGQKVLQPVQEVYPFKQYAVVSGRAAQKISAFLQHLLDHTDDVDDTQGSITFVRLLVKLQHQNHTAINNIVATFCHEHLPSIEPQKPKTSRGSLTKHNKNVHWAPHGALRQPFPYPECERLGMPQTMIDGPVQWSNHTERCHGRQNAPNPPPGLGQLAISHQKNLPLVLADHQEQRLICGDIFEAGSGFSRHITMAHERTGFFERVFNCPECERHNATVVIEDLTEWRVHINLHHRGRFNHLFPKRKSEIEEEDYEIKRSVRKKTRIEIPPNGLMTSSIDPTLWED
ncbi:hypothetical protein BX600DRAFT_515367 [Xylariales sp. PMI_506]|nr:hypothetical protein BX600DRAFT_515367 [Xylariales sp. PMI_506]